MAFFSAPDVEWLYSGVTKTKPSKEAILAAHAWVCGWEYCPSDGGIASVEVRELVVEQVDQLVIFCVADADGVVVRHPAGHGTPDSIPAGCCR